MTNRPTDQERNFRGRAGSLGSVVTRPLPKETSPTLPARGGLGAGPPPPPQAVRTADVFALPLKRGALTVIVDVDLPVLHLRHLPVLHGPLHMFIGF